MRALVVVACLLMSRLAIAGPAVGLLVTGEPALQAPVGAQLDAWLKLHGYVKADALSTDGRNTLLGCFVIEDMACARQTFERQVRADSLVFVQIELRPGVAQREVTLTGYWFVKDHDAVVEKRACQPCTDAALNHDIDDLMEGLSHRSGLDKSRLKVVSSPLGLIVMLDKINIGVTPVERDVTSGVHEIRLVQDGRVVGAKTITAEAGEMMEVTVPIGVDTPPAPPAPPPVAPPHRETRVLPALLITSGLAAAATGGVFLYYGHKGAPTDVYIYPTATRTGAIVAGAGGVLVITGLIAWLRGPSATSAPSASITRDGTMVGWAGRF